MLIRSMGLAVFISFFIISKIYGNETMWPQWLAKDDVVTLALDSKVALFPITKINAIQFERVSQWAKSGPAVLGFIGKDGIFKRKFDVEYSEFGSSAIRFDKYVITDKLELKTAKGLKTIGIAEVLESVQKTFLRNSRRMPYFDLISQKLVISDQFILLANPIEIDGVKISALYFEPYYSLHPGSQVTFGNLDSEGVFADAPVNSRMWSFGSGGSILIHLDTAKSKYLTLYRASKGAFIVGNGIVPVKLFSLSVVRDQEIFFKKTSRNAPINCNSLASIR